MPRVGRRFKTIDAPLYRIQTLILSRGLHHDIREMLQLRFDLGNALVDVYTRGRRPKLTGYYDATTKVACELAHGAVAEEAGQ